MKQISKISGGVSGQPSLATLEKGKRLHEYLITRLIEVIHEFQRDLEVR